MFTLKSFNQEDNENISLYDGYFKSNKVIRKPLVVMNNQVSINDYRIDELLYESKKSKVVKATHTVSGKKVILKFLNKKFPLSEEIEQFKQEYEIASALETVESIGTYKIVKVESSLFLVMDDFGAESLKNMMLSEPISLLDALTIGIKLSDALNSLHKKNIIHKDINPSNILWNKNTNQIRIIDFGISCQLPNEFTEIVNPKELSGTHQYISPEQTGRMNRTVDYRTDLYSLGITLYEIFSGKLPFTGEDAMELTHCHIAKTPEPLQNIFPIIPNVVSDIVMKLMAKDPEERYQSALGVKHDLELCLEQLTTRGKIEPFALAQQDFSGRFQIPQKLYGRENEIEIMLQAFEKTSRGKNELLLVSGYSGIGKSVLVNEIYKPIIRKTGYFIKGKFDQFKKDIPLYAFSQAFSELIFELLSEPEKRLLNWKQDFIETLGPNGQIIVDYIPEIEQIIGKQSHVQELNPDKVENRFLMTFRNFVKIIAKPQHPLVLFLDDMQWCDQLSLKLIKDITTKEIPYFMLICAYRNNEVSDGHLLNLTFDEIGKIRNFDKLVITNLSPNSVSNLIADTLHCQIHEVEELSKIIYLKTNGNPFFTKELLNNLFREDLLQFDFISKKWKWELNKIKNANISANLVEIIEDRLLKLPEDCISALKIASCIGNKFDLRTTSIIMNRKITEVSDMFLNAIDEGIIYAERNRYKLYTIDENLNISYRFQDYRIQQIVYSLNDIGRKKEIHFHIGKILLNQLSEEEKNERLIEIVNHLNDGINLISDTKEKEQLKILNLKSGDKAMASAAYSSGLQFFQKGISLLDVNEWQSNYNLTFNLYKGYAQCAYQTGKHEEAEKYIDLLLNNVHSKLDKVSIIAMRLRQYATVGKPREAIAEGIKGLSILGVKLSPRPGIGSVLYEIIKAKILLGRRNPCDLVNDPVLQDPEKKMVACLLTEMGAPAFVLGNDNLYGVLALKVVNLSLKNGYAPESPYAYVAYGMLLSIVFKDLASSYEFGKLALMLNEKHNDIEYKCRVIAAYGVLTHHWNKHWSTLTEWYKKGVEAGIHSGDLFYLGHCACNCVIWNPRLNFQTLIEQHLKYMSLLHEIGFTDATNTAEMRLQVLRNYRGETNDRFSLNDKDFNETRTLNDMTKRKYISGVAIYHLAKSELYLFYNEPRKAYNHIEEVDKLVKSLVGLNYTFILSVTAFHSASACLSDKSINSKDRRKFSKRLNKEYDQMKRWAKHNPGNYLHHLLLMEAELSKHKGQYKKAASLYVRAIENANKNEWLKDEAFANELIASFFAEQNLNTAALGYRQQAHYLYKRLGATAKVLYLEEKYPELTKHTHSFDIYNTTDYRSSGRKSVGTTIENAISYLDMITIAKASQAISGEIVFETLLKNLMQIVVENAGAQRGVLLLSEKNNLIVQSELFVESNEINVLQSILLRNYSDIPHSIINYVTNSKKSIVLGDALHEGQFTQDPYILANKPKSILVEPIIKQNRLEGILYLENNLNTRVFSKGRQQLLNILSTQIAISIENSRLYESLEEKVKERTIELLEANRLLSQKNEQIKIQKEELEKLNASKDKLFSIIAHDLKSPFNAILGLSELLANNLSEYTKAEIVDLANGINQSGQNVYKLLENLLEWAMTQTGSTTFKPEPLLLNTIVNEVIGLTSGSSLAKDLQIINETSERIYVNADRNMLLTILRNLVTNAIKYSHKSDTIKIKAVDNEDEVHVSIVDNGIGIEGDKIEKLFKIKEKISMPGTANEKGTGLGLILCKEFIERHDGKIWVESKYGEGCKFHFTLPRINNPIEK